MEDFVPHFIWLQELGSRHEKHNISRKRKKYRGKEKKYVKILVRIAIG